MGLTEFWRYPRFFAKEERCPQRAGFARPEGTSLTISSEGLKLSDEDFQHARRVLRLKDGDKVVLCEDCTDFLCEFSADGAFVVLDSAANQAEPSVHVTLYQCLPKSDKFDFVIQKAVELGVSEIVPVISKRCVSRPDEKAISSKLARWNKIAYEAAKQCGRGRVVSVRDVISFKNAVGAFNSANLHILFYECGGKRLNELISPNVSEISVLIGPEGGFEASEVDLATKAGWLPATLGKRILRVDTASIVGISLIMSLTENI